MVEFFDIDKGEIPESSIKIISTSRLRDIIRTRSTNVYKGFLNSDPDYVQWWVNYMRYCKRVNQTPNPLIETLYKGIVSDVY